MEEDLPSKWREKKAGVAILVSDKMDFKPTKIKRDKEGHYIMVKGSMQQELTILNTDAPNAGAPRYIKQVLKDLKRHLDSRTIIVGDQHSTDNTGQINKMESQQGNPGLECRFGPSRPKVIYRILHPKNTENTLFSGAHCTYSKTDHIMGSKTLHSKCKRKQELKFSSLVK